MFTSVLEIEFYPHVDPQMSSLGLLEAKITPEKGLCAIIVMVVVVVVAQWLVVLMVVIKVGVLALVVDFREVVMISPPELAHCAPSTPPTVAVYYRPTVKLADILTTL